MTEPDPEPGWYPDPSGRHDQRYFDGSEWTGHISNGGRVEVEAPAPLRGPSGHPASGGTGLAPTAVPVGPDPAVEALPGLLGCTTLIVSQAASAAGSPGPAAGSEFRVLDQTGVPLGSLRVRTSAGLRRGVEVVTQLSQVLASHADIVDPSGAPILMVRHQPAVFVSTFEVSDAGGRSLGEIVARESGGWPRWSLESEGQVHAVLDLREPAGWDLTVVDPSGAEIGRVTKSWDGFGRAGVDPSNHYAVVLSRPSGPPLRQLVIAAGLTIGTGLVRDGRGFTT